MQEGWIDSEITGAECFKGESSSVLHLLESRVHFIFSGRCVCFFSGFSSMIYYIGEGEGNYKGDESVFFKISPTN